MEDIKKKAKDDEFNNEENEINTGLTKARKFIPVPKVKKKKEYGKEK